MAKKRKINSLRANEKAKDDIGYIDSKLRELEGLPPLPSYKENFDKNVNEVKISKKEIMPAKKLESKITPIKKKDDKKAKPKKIGLKKSTDIAKRKKPVKAKRASLNLKKLVKAPAIKKHENIAEQHKRKIQKISKKRITSQKKVKDKDADDVPKIIEKEKIIPAKKVEKLDGEAPEDIEIKQIIPEKKLHKTSAKFHIPEKKTQKKKTSGEFNTSKENAQKEKINIKNNVPEEEKKPKTNIKLHTPFDDVVELVENKKRVAISYIIDKYKIDKDTAINWGRILSERGLIELEIPAFGEAEFRKNGEFAKEKDGKKQKKKLKGKPSKKKIFIVTVIAVALIWAIIFLIIFLIPDTEPDLGSIQRTIINDTEEIEQIPSGIEMEKAFSGIGSYACMDAEGKIRYSILNDRIKLEATDGSSSIVIKNNKTYTFNKRDNSWKEGEVPEGLAVPGSSIYPKTRLNCAEVELKEATFST